MDASVNRIASSADERALLVALQIKGADNHRISYSLDELKLLVKTAGGIVVDAITVRRDSIDPAFIIGKGYVEKFRNMISEHNLKLIVFDMNNIKPAQIRNLEEDLKCRVVGRNEIILDIFARRARSAESKIQVELAQLRYILPRLKGLGGVLSRLGGGIGTRGPGETMLETDRRHILRRIDTLSRKLKHYREHRKRTRSARESVLSGAVVGYTNAGKSTLINLLARDDLFVEDRLFATLDSYTRSAYIGPGVKTLLTDTVGFIQNLPANLIESFRSTLEDIENSSFIIHVVDSSAPDIENNIRTVEAELAELSIQDKPVIMFFNKSDLVDEKTVNIIHHRYSDAVIGSAKAKINLDQLKVKIAELHEKHNRVFPFDAGLETDRN
ncbi:MAG TPA: GTPase HflX [Spirochaetota bacterium]|nr:GTPase HflX [Spirochaetota bacterium]